jgi:hypothetical protein
MTRIVLGMDTMNARHVQDMTVEDAMYANRHIAQIRRNHNEYTGSD